MRDPRKKGNQPKPKSKKAVKSKKPEKMETDAGPSNAPTVWRPGVDPMGEDEELDYDPTAYDCFHQFQLEWPCLSFDIIKDDLGAPRSTFPHTMSLVAGTQASSAKLNSLAFLKLANLGQGRHGKKAAKAEDEEESSSSDEEDDSSMVSDEEDGPPPRMHYRLVPHVGGVNRIRVCPHQPGVVAVWADTAQVKIYDGSKIAKDLANEQEPSPKTKTRVDLKPLHSHSHAMEGFSMDWSPVKAGRLATGDCWKSIHVWDPQEGGRWQVSGAYAGHEASVEDLQWSPTEETVFASCSVDKTMRVWDTRERSKPMITVQAHDTDVNVIGWNRQVTYMMASGADDGVLRIWDLRSFAGSGHVSHFAFHKSHISSLEWCPYEGSMLATASADNQLAVWDLALERDPEEEAALAPQDNALAPEDLPAQLLFLHAGQHDPKEMRWHPQIPGLITSTAADGFHVFKASNM